MIFRRCLKRLSKNVKNFYGDLFQSKENKLQQNCCSFIDPNYKLLLEDLHPDIKNVDFGCGSPIPSDVENCTVLDLGSGSGKDVFILSKMVGENGSVIGVDFGENAIELSESFIDYHMEKYNYPQPNVQFKMGNIEDLESIGIESSTVDVLISNCVINLSESKRNVFQECFRVLKEGGEMFFSDIFCDLRLPDRFREDNELWSECVSGSLYLEDFNSIVKDVGFGTFKIVEGRKIDISEELKSNFKFKKDPGIYSLTVRLIKASQIENTEEDYGGSVRYIGADPFFKWDMLTTMKKNINYRVSRNTAEMLKVSRYKFEVNDGIEHLGRFKSESFWDLLDQINGNESGSCC